MRRAALAAILAVGLLAGCSCPHERWTGEMRDEPAEAAAHWPDRKVPTVRRAVYTCTDCGERVGQFTYEHPWRGPEWGEVRDREGD